ncbi:hypothetical protein FRC09_011724 [Ceratobasidium sp. 395]|nr:hypothetical protein FRC09_011724 [Ceratobasidium sp. 395]
MAKVKAEAVERDTAEIVRKERAEDLPARKAEIEQMVKARYGSEDQLKVLETEYVNDDAIEMLREVMEHVIVHQRGDSKDETGAPIIPIPPYVEVALWSVLDEEEQAALARVNKVYWEHKERRLKGLSFDPGELKWEDFLTSQKDACLLAALVKIRKWAKREKVSPIPEMLKIPAGWTAESIDSVLSSRLRAVDEAVKHFWEGNPKPPVYRADGSRDADLEDQQPDPPLLLRPRKFIIFIEFTVHRCMVKKMLELHGRKCVEYHGDMTVKQRQKAADTFKEDRECRVMLISKVGGAGLNLDVASILIFMSPLWSGLERKQLIGRLWRLGQLNQVIILDIIAPGGPDLVLAGYAGSKTALANNFLRVDAEQQLYEARCTSNTILRDMERADDPTSDDELIEEAPVAGLPQARPSRVQPRKRKADALEDADEATSSGHDVSELGAYASATGKRARTTETSAPSGSATLSASHHQPATGSLSPVGQLGATNLAAPLKAAKFRGQRGGGRGRRAGGSGRGRDTSPELSHSLESRASSSLRSPRSPAAEPRYPSPQPPPRVRSSHFGLRSSPPLLPSSSPPPPPSSPPMAPSSPVSSPSPSPPPPSRVLSDILRCEDARVQPQRATPVPVLGLRSVVVSSGSVRADTPMRTQQSADPAPPRPKPRPKLRAAPSTAEIEDSTDIFDLSSSTVPRVRRETPALPHDGLASSAYKTQGSSREPIPARRSPPTALAAPRGNSPGDELQAPGVETTAAPLNPAASLPAKRLPPSGSERGADGVERMRAIQARLSSTATTRRVSAVVVPIPRKPQGSDGAGTQSTLNSQAAQAEGQGASSGTGSSRAVEPSARQQQQHKRSGVGRQTIKAAAGTSRAKAKATTLDERDAQLLATSAGPSAQPRRQRPSMFDEQQ